MLNQLEFIIKELGVLREEVHALQEKFDATQTYTVTEHPHIYMSEKMHNGEPTVRGTALTVRTIVECTHIGESVDEILEAYPILTRAQVYDALSYYYDHAEEIEKYIRENQEASWRLLQRASSSRSTPMQT
ncbi:hypothetical protein ANRL1_04175 [Anaerolineae bacterium]|nr:hypothetical protein ANRL1_04175 [Anaerolineae bacterium]